jgi:hypothetical protein
MGNTLTKREIDRIYTALRPRLSLKSAGPGSGGSGTVPPHTHSADQIASNPTPLVAATNVQDAIEELDYEKLARSGEQAWLGPDSLDMNTFGIDNVDEMSMVGTAAIYDPKLIEFDPAVETLIKNLDAIEFDLAGEHTTHVEGGLHWDPLVKMLTLDVEADGSVYQAEILSVFVRVKNAVGSTIQAGRVVRMPGTYDAGVPEAYFADASMDIDDAAGVALHDIGPGSVGWICTRGLVFSPGAFAGLGGTYYLGTSNGDLTTAPDSDQKGCYTTVRIGHAVGDDDTFIVDIERVPLVRKLSDVKDVSASCGDVLVRQINPNSGCEQWTPSGLWTEVILDFGDTDPPSDMKVFTITGDPRVKSDSIITMVHSALPPQSGESPPDRDEDEAEFDCFACSCVVVPGYGPSWDFRAYIHSLRGRVVGRYRFNYTVSNPASWNCYYNPV